MYSFQALQVLIFLLPGFISLIILNNLVYRRDKGDLSKLIEALAFSVLIYFIYSTIFGRSPVLILQEKLDDMYKYSVTYSKSVTIWIAIITIIVPIIFGLFISNDWHMKIARKLSISKRTSRESVWYDVFHDVTGKLIVLYFKNGRRLIGWPMYYSERSDERFVYLRWPAWIKEDGKYDDLNAHGILVTPEAEIDLIEFVDYPEEGE